MNSSDDEKLDAMLRNVSVPSGLKDRLRRIPNEPAVGRPDSNWTIGKRLIVLALAAGLTGIAIWLTWPLVFSQPDQLVRDLGSVPTDVAKGADKMAGLDSETDTKVRLEQLEMQIELLQQSFELRNLESELAELHRSSPATALATVEQQSLAVFLADEAAIGFGASRESVRADMQNIIERYPNTSGATMASQFLAHANANPMIP